MTSPTSSAVGVARVSARMRLNWAGLSVPDFGSLIPIVLEELPERSELLLRRAVVDAIDQRRSLRLQGLGRGDIGGDHELLDQAMGVEPGRARHAPHAALVVEQDLPFRQIEVERPPLGAREHEARIGPPQGPEHGIEQRARDLVEAPVDCALRLLIGEARGGPHQGPEEAVAELSAVLVEHHAHGKAGPRLVLDERAEIVRDPLRQHRHHAVREVDRVAALPRFLVQRAPGPHV